MVSKDQAIGWLIFLACIIIMICYLVGLLWLGGPFSSNSSVSALWQLPFYLVAIPVLLAFVLILGIGAWIGLTMATTPPPKPIEEFETEEKKETATPAEEEGKKEE